MLLVRLYPFENAGLKVIAARMVQMSRTQAEDFYAVHRERPFFKDLVDFIFLVRGWCRHWEGEMRLQKIRFDGPQIRKKLTRVVFAPDFADSYDQCSTWFRFSGAAAVEIAYFFPDLKVS